MKSKDCMMFDDSRCKFKDCMRASFFSKMFVIIKIILSKNVLVETLKGKIKNRTKGHFTELRKNLFHYGPIFFPHILSVETYTEKKLIILKKIILKIFLIKGCLRLKFCTFLPNLMVYINLAYIYF